MRIAVDDSSHLHALSIGHPETLAGTTDAVHSAVDAVVAAGARRAHGSEPSAFEVDVQYTGDHRAHVEEEEKVVLIVKFLQKSSKQLNFQVFPTRHRGIEQ